MKSPALWFHWIPRILCIIAILFISWFALDAFAPGLPLWMQVRDFLIHLMPTYILILILWFAWVNEKWGGLLFIVFGVLTGIPVFLMNYHRTGSVLVGLSIVLLINVPVIMVGVMFMVSNYLKVKSNGPK
jgi:hypothetical protein